MIELMLCFQLMLGFVAGADSIEGKEFAPQVKVGEVELKLNGLGLRKVTKFGIPVKVYVAGLYLKNPSKDAAAVLKSADPKRLELKFLRRVDKELLREAWLTGFSSNCQADCSKSREGLNQFNKMMTDILADGGMTLTFMPDAVEVELRGREFKTGRIYGSEFSRDLMGIFIGEKPPTEAFKKGLLGLK